MKKYLRLDVLITVLAIFMAIYHLVYPVTIFQGPILHQNTHFGFALLIVFLLGLKERSKKRRPLMIVLILMTLAAIAYVQILYDDLEYRGGFPTSEDVVIGVLLAIISIMATWHVYGLALPIVVLLLVAYAFLGSYFPEPFTTMYVPFDRVISKFGIGMQGMYGTILGVSANYIFLFVLLGGLLQASGVSRFFTIVGELAARFLRGGPAMTAVVSSCLVGMVMGSGAGNVAVTGVYTIPLMKRMGYRPEQAGAVEAAASTGGQIMPPVMGAAAFVMAGVTGIPYARIMIAAFIPAILYFATVGLNVQLLAMKLDLKSPKTVKVNVKELAIYGPIFAAPIAVMMVLLLKNYSPMYAGFWSIISVIVAAIISNFFRQKQDRTNFSQWVSGFANGAISGAKIGVVCGVLGLIVASMTMTGLAVRIPHVVEMWSGGNVVIALVITALVAIFLGMGMPVVAVYTVIAVAVAPLLVSSGVSLFSTHFYAFLFAVFSGVTPPVAMCALVASNIANANYMKTAVESTKLALAGFILPFGVIFCPWIILQSTDSVTGILGIISFLLATTLLSFGLQGFYLTSLNRMKRAVLLAAGLLALASLLSKIYIFLIIGVVLAIAMTARQLRERRRRPLPVEPRTLA